LARYTESRMRHRVVILGGGFAGLYAAQSLGRTSTEITLVDKRNFHLFQPLLYQVATGALSPGDIASPLRFVLNGQRNTRVLMAEAGGLDAIRREVFLSDGTSIPYDTLIVATGATHHYFGHETWAQHAPGLKTIEDATEIRSRILSAFERAEMSTNSDERLALLTFVVVGGGATGVELAGALGEIAHDTLRKDFRGINPADARIFLIEGADRLLPVWPPDLSRAAERALIRFGVRAHLNARVTNIDAEGVRFETAEGPMQIASRTVIWAAGVQASPWGKILAQAAGAPLDGAGRVLVSDDLSVPSHPEILVIGDLAHIDQDGQPVPGVAPAAMQQGRFAARLIEARLRNCTLAPFRYRNKGNLATIGRNRAVAELGRLHLSGYPAWLLWVFIHLLYIVEFESRLLIAIQWAYDYFTWNRGARLITGTGKMRPEE